MWQMTCFFVALCNCLVGFITAIESGPNVRQFRVNPDSQCPHQGVKYASLGCFSLDPPFNNTDWLPQSLETINLHFFLYTRANPSSPDVLGPLTNRTKIDRTHFDHALPTKCIVHGFLQDAAMDFVVNMTRALLYKAAMNVIVVSWADGAGFPYARAAANTRVVGAALARLIQISGSAASQFHIIGHSLGAHVAGYAGAATPGLGRITGLDPAQPNFSGYHRSVRLDSSDARLVDVIHTDAVPYETVGGYGMIEPVGHIDFYPNGGHHQPGCPGYQSVVGFLEDAVSGGIDRAEVGVSCSHERSTQLFTASITLSAAGPGSCQFQAVPCSSEVEFMAGRCLNCGNRPCPTMGYDVNLLARPRGVFYLNTTDSEPFCGYQYFVALTLATNMTSTEGAVSVMLRGSPSGQQSWTPLYEGRLSGGDKVSGFLVSEEDIGEVTEVRVKFQDQGFRLPWRGQDLVLRKVEVEGLLRSHRKYFCTEGQGQRVEDGAEVILSSGTFTPLECH